MNKSHSGSATAITLLTISILLFLVFSLFIYSSTVIISLNKSTENTNEIKSFITKVSTILASLNSRVNESNSKFSQNFLADNTLLIEDIGSKYNVLYDDISNKIGIKEYVYKEQYFTSLTRLQNNIDKLYSGTDIPVSVFTPLSPLCLKNESYELIIDSAKIKEDNIYEIKNNMKDILTLTASEVKKQFGVIKNKYKNILNPISIDSRFNVNFVRKDILLSMTYPATTDKEGFINTILSLRDQKCIDDIELSSILRKYNLNNFSLLLGTHTSFFSITNKSKENRMYAILGRIITNSNYLDHFILIALECK
jgi:hypothetical protein